MPRLKDYIDLFHEEDVRLCQEAERLPKCCICKEPIYQEEAICHLGNWYCEDCEEEFFDIVRKENTERISA